MPDYSEKYNESGKVASKKVFTEDGELQWTVEYHYNEAFKIIEKKATDPDGNQIWRTSYTYNETSGQLLREVNHNRLNQPEYTKVYEYEDEKIETIMYGPDGGIRWRKSTIQTDQGKTKRLYYYYPNGTRIKGIIREFNSMGRISVEKHIDEIGAVYRRFENEYDELGRVVGRRVYNHKGDLHRRVWIEYLENGHIQRVRHILPEEGREEEYTYEYEIDERGAWLWKKETVRIELNEGNKNIVHKSVWSRDIEYYPYTREEKE